MPNELKPFAALKDALLKQNSCDAHPPVARTRSPEEAALFHEAFKNCSPGAREEHLRWLALNDLFYFGVYILHRWHWIGETPVSGNQVPLSPERKARISTWAFARCTEVQDDPNGNLDIWAREHMKSEIITFALSVQDALRNSNETIGIFSHSRPMAKQFLRLIMTELETNEELMTLFPDVLYKDPRRETKWSQDDGIILRRDSNRKEGTFEAWGLIDGQPTSKRFSKLVYDDVNGRTETSEAMISKTTEELQNSYALTASDPPIIRYVGTFQEIGDTTQKLIDSGAYKVRRRPAVDADGAPLFFSEEKLAFFKKTQSPKVFALQFLLDPKKARDAQEIGFESTWFQTYKTPRNIKSLNRYILVDPAGKSKESNSFFALWVVGLGADHCKYILDGVLDQLSLVQRANILFEMVRKWDPLKVVYEQFAYQSDIEHYRDRMDRENFRFTIVPVAGVTKSKDQRIERLMPMFRDSKILFPEKLPYTNAAGEQLDLVKRFREVEYDKFPYNPKQRDQLDALSRLCDEAEVNYVYPRSYGQTSEDGSHWLGGDMGGGGWMSQ